MSRRIQLNLYIEAIQKRLRLAAGLRGAAIVTGTALLATIVFALLLNHYAFPATALTPARMALFATLFVAAAAALAWPLVRLTRARAIHRAEARFPELDKRLLTFAEREAANDPFLDLLAADTLTLTAEAPASDLIPQAYLAAFVAAAVLCTGVLWWLVIARPGPVGYGASLLWTGPKKDLAPLYEIRVTPGDQAVRRNSDQMVTAQLIGLDSAKVSLFARFRNAGKWDPVPMQPMEGGSGFQFLFTGLPDSVEYYVAAGPVESKHFHFRVVDLPAVKQIEVTYRYPKWTGMQPVSEEHGGDLRALEGTEADLTVVMDSPLKDGVLSLDGGQPLHLTPLEGNRYRGTVVMTKDGAYHVAAIDHDQPVRLSEDYFISTSKATPPEIAIERPGADYKASPIEEVTIGVRANAEFGLRNMALHYSVNGGTEQTVPLLDHAGAKTSKATTTLKLEDFKMAPGDVISLYATAGDAHAEAKTEISFIQADPFEREFSQSQAGGGGGGGGGQQQGNQTDISRREKELIAATWKQQNDKTATPQQNADMGKVLSEAQDKLREQALALSGRMQSRDLASANEEFTSFEKDMQIAATAMVPSSEQLKARSWPEALPNEQKALQALLRAEATFRKIQVAFGQKGGGGGGGGGAGRDLASLFDLEMDTEKNQYETAQTGSASEEQAKKVDDALAKLDALAKRQEEIAQQQQNKPQTFQQRWQQEMLRREAEELQRQMEQMQKNQQNAVNGSQSGQGQPSGSSSEQAGNSSKDGNADPRVTQALNRLRAANEEMRRAGTQGQGGPEQAQAQARQAAEQLKEATNLLGGAQKQQATGKLDGLSREADRIAREEAAQANRIQSLKNQAATSGSATAEQYATRMQQRNKLAEDRQRLSDDLGHLQKGLRDTAREMASTQPGTSSRLRDALGQMDQSDLDNRVQRTADWLRRGIDPNSNGTEAEIARNLKDLNQQLRAAQQGAASEASGKPGQGGQPGQGSQIAALDHVGRLRSEIERLGRAQNPGQSAGQGQQGQGQQQQGQQGKGGQQQGNGQQGGGVQTGNRPQQTGDGQQQAGANTGDLGNRQRQGGGDGGPADRNLNTGNNTYAYTGLRVRQADRGTNPADSERVIRQGLTELNQLRAAAKNDPAALKEIADLAKEMQQLDPSRFPGNPAMVEALHTQVLADVDKLELQLSRHADAPKGQVRTGKTPSVPAGYQDAVADYYRRLGKGQ
ncbi:hypothetical protein SAMN05421771_1280 [Granulicella pectinivorans]|uniref:DUF4175 family protein n=1 Tax=Granulicella pectinivorans TaxID=474950 RepID=A0A1I6LUQ2_9BACT|nr:hypothetical protein [Granulicella pectinivorans]SFS07012.1 hypothetical protein SAMN05421771_1280 [Granulicella pectinivorans]